jgi:glutaredoxin
MKSLGTLLLVCAIGAGAGLLAAKGYLDLGSKPTHIEGDYAAMRDQTGESVILLGTAWCGYCAKTRAHLEQRGVVFADLVIDQSERAAKWMADLGAVGVPVILVGDLVSPKLTPVR